MSLTDTHERRVGRFYDESPGGEAAALVYREMMGDTWFHGDWAVQKAGGSQQQATDAMLRRFITHAELDSESFVLEFGSGVGGAAVAIAAGTGAHVVGVSNTDTLNQRARQLAAERGLADRATFLTIGHEDYKNLSAWPAKTFDAVLFMESVCHLTDKQAFFNAAFRVTKPAGRLVGLDWICRPYGDHRTPEQIAAFIKPVCEHFRLAWPLGTLDSYTAMIEAAGFGNVHAADEFANELCLGSTDMPDVWRSYQGRSSKLAMTGKTALDAARAAGVFTVGWWSAVRPATSAQVAESHLAGPDALP